MKSVVYKITYLPHLNTEFPKYYVGSKYNYRGNYFGSPSSMQIFSYTDGLPLRSWWRRIVDTHPHNILFEILCSFENIAPNDLLKKENEIQKSLNVMSKEYFNQSFATVGWYSKSKSENTRKLMSMKTKMYWNSLEGLEKKRRLIEFNKKIHKNKKISEEHKNIISSKMKNRKFSEETKKKMSASGKKSWNRDTRKSVQRRKVRHNDKIFDNYDEAAKFYLVSKSLIVKYCSKKMKGWNYHE